MRRRLTLIVAMLATCGLCGCYERVVGAKGMGAGAVSVSEPNGPEGSRTKVTTQKKTVRLKDSPTR